jgi:hypothetical protein
MISDKIVPLSIKVDCTNLSRYIASNDRYGSAYAVDFDETWFKDENGEPISYLRRGAFAHARINSIALPDTITVIPHRCFEQSSFDVYNTLVLPKTVQRIESNGFYNSQLYRIQLHEGIEFIGDQAFYNSYLQEVTLPKSLQSIEAEAFSFCSQLRTVTFNSKPEISSTYNYILFNGSTYLTTINVPWSEGEVAGAPWGATNATINYNYTGG